MVHQLDKLHIQVLLIKAFDKVKIVLYVLDAAEVSVDKDSFVVKKEKG